jgi:hypothetical protein
MEIQIIFLGELLSKLFSLLILAGFLCYAFSKRQLILEKIPYIKGRDFYGFSIGKIQDEAKKKKKDKIKEDLKKYGL